MAALFSCETAHLLKGSRVLVTGATGFVGQHFVRQGVAAGVEMHTLGRRPGPAGSVFHRADLEDREQTRAAVLALAPDVVVNLASPGVAFGTASYLEMLRVLVLGAEALLSACSELARPPLVVHIGTGFEYADRDRPIREDDPLVPSATRYGAAKAAASATVGSFAHALPILILRPFNIYGAGDVAPRIGSYLVSQTRSRLQCDVTASEQVRDFLHVDDCTRCFWALAHSASRQAGVKILNIGSGAPIALRGYIEAIAAGLRIAGLQPEIRFGAKPYRPGEPMISVPDISKLSAAHDWKPHISLAEGANDFVQWSLRHESDR